MLAHLRAVKQVHEAHWLAQAGVVAVGIGQAADGRPAIVVSVERDDDAIRQLIPTQVDGVPVELRLAGPIRAQDPS
ncbi:MAG TPA: hypothetical protein VFM52_06665 [Rhodanobacter sp.]|nr:hypothetical protein [Rhodanobacter sp.]